MGPGEVGTLRGDHGRVEASDPVGEGQGWGVLQGPGGE